MDITIATAIIKEEILKFRPNYDGSIDINDDSIGVIIDELFSGNDSKIVTYYDRGNGLGDEFYYIYKIDHPEHGVGYYRVLGHYDSWEGQYWHGKRSMAEQFSREITDWRAVE